MAEPSANSAVVKQLTKKKKENGALYTRRDEVELHIAAVLKMDGNQILDFLENEQRDSENYIFDETIVYLLRQPGTEQNFREILYTELTRRIWKLLKKFSSRFSDYAAFEDFRQKIELAILKKIFNFGSDAADYAEVNFGDFVVKTAKVAWRGELVKIEREKDLFYQNRETEDGEESQIENTFRSSDAPADYTMTLREGLEKLPPNIRLVAELMLDGWQIESKHPEELTISKKLGVSSRTIRNWLVQAREILKDYRAEVKK